MKLSLAKDLAPIRADACRRIDAFFEARAAALDPCPTIHAAKARAARAAFARLRIEPDCVRLEVDAAVLAIDADRLALKARIGAAAAEQEIIALLAGAGMGAAPTVGVSVRRP
ncbi:MAG: hypothetical protein ACLPSW_01520 [Roseiarcus sp.]